jgi:hypothetical protein
MCDQIEFLRGNDENVKLPPIGNKSNFAAAKELYVYILITFRKIFLMGLMRVCSMFKLIKNKL